VIGIGPQLLHLVFVRGAYRLAFDPEASTSLATLSILIGYIFTSFGLLAMNAAYWREAWPLAAAFSIQLVWGLWLFSRILTHRN